MPDWSQEQNTCSGEEGTDQPGNPPPISGMYPVTPLGSLMQIAYVPTSWGG